MQRIEECWTLDIEIKYIEGKFGKPGTNLVTQQKIEDSTQEITDKIPLQKVIIVENLKKYHYTKGVCQWLDEPWLYLDIRYFGEGPRIESIIDGTYVCPDNTDPAVKTF